LIWTKKGTIAAASGHLAPDLEKPALHSHSGVGGNFPKTSCAWTILR